MSQGSDGPPAVGQAAKASLPGSEPHLGRLFIVGLGPGDPRLLTNQARQALAASDVVVGYRGYLEQAADFLLGKQVDAGELGAEVARAEQAVELAAGGRRVALVSSGDAGVYGMASPVFEALERYRRSGRPEPDIEVVPGISAVLAAGALLGAPLGADFAVMSLSDLLTPWPVIERRVSLAAEADFVLAFYNPASRRRDWQFDRARELILQHRPASSPTGLVRQAYRPDQVVRLAELGSVDSAQLDMRTIVIVGNRSTRRFGDRLVTPRGYPSGSEA